MNDAKLNDTDRERQLDRIIADYACRIDAGEQVDRAALLEKYADLADLLAEHFEDLETAEAWRQLVQPESSQIETEAYRTIKTTMSSPTSLPVSRSPLTPEQRSGKELFGRYRIEGILGEGAMGAVYLASDTKLNRHVALKLPKCSQDDPDLMPRFLREARAAATLNHRNICQVYDIDSVGDCHYISMAYIEGSPLSSFARETKPRQPRAVAQLVYKLAIAMATAHDKGIVHRDLKPSNIMVDGEQEPVIMDFGLAAMTVSDENMRLTQFGMTLGTPAYMSPEQIDGDLARIDGRSDVFSLGVIFYELLCGKLPFQGPTVTAVWRQIATIDPVTPSQYREDLDPVLEATCLTMLAKDPDRRYADMREVAQALKDYLKDSPSTGTPEVDLTTVTKVAKRQRSPEFWRIQLRRVALGVVGVVVLLTLVFVLRTPEGDLTVTVNDDNLEVIIDNDTVEFTDKKWSGKKKARRHRLALKLLGVEIPFDESKGAFVLNGRQVMVKLGKVELKSDRFEVTRDGETVITIAIVERPVVVKSDDIPQLTVASQPPPRTPLPDGPPDEVLIFDKHTDRVLDVAVSPDGQVALSGSYDGTVRLWEIASGKEIHVLRHDKPGATRSPRVVYVGFSHSGKFAYSSSLDEELIYIWNLQTGVLFRTVKQASTGLLHAAFLSENSKLIVGSAKENVVRTWDIHSAAVSSQFETPNTGTCWLSSNGQFMLRGDGDGGEAVVEFWDCGEANRKQTYSGHKVRVSACAVSTDGTTALSGDDNASVHLWNTATGELIHELKGHHPDAIGGLAFSPDGRFAISSSRAQISAKGQFGHARERMIRLWNLETGQQVHQFSGHGSHIHAVTFTPDGRFALSASSDKTVRVWRLPDEVWPKHVTNASPLAIAPDLSVLKPFWQDDFSTNRNFSTYDTESVTCRVENGHGSIHINRGDWKCLKDIQNVPLSSDFACLVKARPSGMNVTGWRLLLTDFARQRFGVEFIVGWDGRLVINPYGKSDNRTFPAVSHSAIKKGAESNELLVIVRGRVLEVYINGVAVCQPKHWQSELSNLRWAVGIVGKTGAHVEFDELKVWSAKEIPMLQERVAAPPIQPTPRTALPDGPPGEVLVFDKHTDRVLDVAVSPDGQLALSGSYDGTVRLWEIASGKEVHVLRHDDADDMSAIPILYVGFSQNGTLGYSSSLRKDIVYVWNLETGTLLKKLTQGIKGPFRAAFLSGDAKLLVGSFFDSKVRVWNIDSASVVHEFNTPNVGQRWFSSKGRFMLQRIRNQQDQRNQFVQFWNCETEQPGPIYTGHDITVTSRCCLSPDGTLALSGDDNAVVHLWNTSTGQLIHKLEGHDKTGAIAGLAFSPDSRFALSSSQAHLDKNGNWGMSRERTIRLWNLETGQQLHQFSGHGSHIHAVTFTPDGPFALSASSDKTVRVWRLPDEGWPKHVANAPPLAVAPFDAEQARVYQNAWADYQGVPVEQTNSIGMMLRLIPPGEFIMGSLGPGSDSNERPEHPVRISRPFLIGASEVTVRQLRQFVEATGYKTEAETDDIGGTTMAPGSVQVKQRPDVNWRNWWEGQTENHPVVNVSWNDAVAFCNWLSEREGLTYRLPTDAESEYACRGGTTTRHPFGEQIDDLHAVANLQDKAFTDMFGRDKNAGSWDDGFALTAPVGSFPANNFGLHDMPGNVTEWCLDWYGLYEPTRQTDPQGATSGTRRVLRGTNFAAGVEGFVSSGRGSVRPSAPACLWGFRVARELDPNQKQGVDRRAATDSLQKIPAVADTPRPASTPPRSIEQIAERRQAYLDKYLKAPQSQAVEEYAASINAASFPPQATLQTTLAVEGLKTAYFKDSQCKMPLNPDIVTQGRTAYFKAQVDADGRVHQIESYGSGGVRSDKATGWAAVRYWFDEDGRKIQETFLDKDDKPAENGELVIVARHAYDSQRERIETRFYGANEEKAEDRLGVHRRVFESKAAIKEFRLDGSPRELWLDPINLGSRINQDAAWRQTVTADGREMYFATGWRGGSIADRKGIYRVVWKGDHWSDPEPVLIDGKPLRGLSPSISSDGRFMAVFGWKSSPYPYLQGVDEFPDLVNYGGADIYISERKNDAWQPLRNAGAMVNAFDQEGGACFIPGTHSLCIATRQNRGVGYELGISDRQGDEWGRPRPLNLSDARNPAFSADGQRLYFSSERKGSFGHDDVWVSQKRGDDWSRPVNLGSGINHVDTDDSFPAMLGDGIMYFSRCGRPWHIWVTGRSDSEAAIRHMADIYAHGDTDSPRVVVRQFLPLMLNGIS